MQNTAFAACSFDLREINAKFARKLAQSRVLRMMNGWLA